MCAGGGGRSRMQLPCVQLRSSSRWREAQRHAGALKEGDRSSKGSGDKRRKSVRCLGAWPAGCPRPRRRPRRGVWPPARGRTRPGSSAVPQTRCRRAARSGSPTRRPTAPPARPRPPRRCRRRRAESAARGRSCTPFRARAQHCVDQAVREARGEHRSRGRVVHADRGRHTARGAAARRRCAPAHFLISRRGGAGAVDFYFEIQFAATF